MARWPLVGQQVSVKGGVANYIYYGSIGLRYLRGFLGSSPGYINALRVMWQDNNLVPTGYVGGQFYTSPPSGGRIIKHTGTRVAALQPDLGDGDTVNAVFLDLNVTRDTTNLVPLVAQAAISAGPVTKTILSSSGYSDFAAATPATASAAGSLAVSNSGWTQPVGGEEFDSGSVYDPVTGAFKAPTDGVYAFSTWFQHQGGVTGETAEMVYSVDGGPVVTMGKVWNWGNNVWPQATGFRLLNLLKNDFVQLLLTQSSPTARTVAWRASFHRIAGNGS